MDIDPMRLLDCTKDALAITKQTTRIIRQAWETRDRHSLLSSLTLSKSRQNK